jgi:hypothetical protein
MQQADENNERSYRLVSAWMILAVVLLVAGCEGADDMPFHPEPPGLEDPPLDRGQFMAEVLPVFDRRGCASLACHGSAQNPFPLTGNHAEPDSELDFFRAADQVFFADPALSDLLLKPLAIGEGGVPHDAPTIFTSTDDPDFQILARWVGADSAGGGQP